MSATPPPDPASRVPNGGADASESDDGSEASEPILDPYAKPAKQSEPTPEPVARMAKQSVPIPDPLAKPAKQSEPTPEPLAKPAKQGEPTPEPLAKTEKQQLGEQAETAEPIPDPLANAAKQSLDEEAKRPSEASARGRRDGGPDEEAALISLADRARWLSIGSFVAGGAGGVLAAFGLSGRVELGALLYLVPVAALNVVLGVLLDRATVSLRAAPKDHRGLGSASTELGRVLVLQLVGALFFVLLVLASLASALMVKNVTEL